VVLEGGIGLAGDLLIEPIKKTLDQVILSIEYFKERTINTAKLGNNAGLTGGMVLLKINHL
jgi:predicted NBD/HSP70 family sugar kinase